VVSEQKSAEQPTKVLRLWFGCEEPSISELWDRDTLLQTLIQ
jgi:hypothetical protein